MPILSAGNFKPAPEGEYQGVLVDIVDEGQKEDAYGKTKNWVRYVFQLEKLMESGKPYVVSARYNATLHAMGKLKPFLQQLRGKAFTAEELKEFDDEQLLGTNVRLNVIHNTLSDGRTFANINSIAPWNTKYGPELEVSSDYVRVKDRPSTEFVTETGATI